MEQEGLEEEVQSGVNVGFEEQDQSRHAEMRGDPVQGMAWQCEEI